MRLLLTQSEYTKDDLEGNTYSDGRASRWLIYANPTPLSCEQKHL